MQRQRFFIRNINGDRYLASFLVSAVTAVLAIRLFLRLTGYPQLGGGPLHIAHMLWGGLLMLTAIIIVLSYLGEAAGRLAAIVGGIGFGTFIDELGKFVTSDHNYFYKPATALIYITFVLTFLAFRMIHKGRRYSKTEYLMNALRNLEEVVAHDLDREECQQTQLFLKKSDQDHALVLRLRQALDEAEVVPTRLPGRVARLKQALAGYYQRIAQLPGFPIAVVSFFVIDLLIRLTFVVALIFFKGLGFADLRIFALLVGRMEHMSFVEGAEFASSLLSGLFVILGIVQIRRSRVAAYRQFERAILTSIFLTQVFVFYQEQLAALVGLCLNILIWIALGYMIDRENANAQDASH
jgi:hypothetical protein